MSDRAFIVGVTAARIDDEVRRELGWPRINLTTWEDDDGRHVKYLNDPAQLHGVEAGTICYLAKGFDERDDWHELETAILERQMDQQPL